MTPALEASRRRWRLVAALMIGAFLARAPLYLSVFPPFEGWDEYQHLGYVARLDETGALPVVDPLTRVPLSIRPLAAAMPHSVSGADQLQEWGVLAYGAYWNAPAPASVANLQTQSSPRLYQAQHPPLAYLLDVPVWRALKTTHPLEAVYAMRALNVLLVTAALALFAGALTRLVPAFGPRAAVLALVCLHPLFFQNVARVANDALALATGVAGISLLLLADRRTLLTRGVLASVCVAASVWSKQTGLTLIPALVLGLPLIGWTHGVPARRLWGATVIAVATFLLLVAPLWLWSYQHYGSIVTTQESIELAARGSVLGALAASLVTVDWPPVLAYLFVPGRPWVGGWSFLPMPQGLDGLYRYGWSTLLLAAAAGAAVSSWRRAGATARGTSRPGADGTALAGLAICATVVVTTALGMIHHALVSQALFGRVMTNPWYFMTALPFLFVLLVRGLGTIHGRVATTASGALAALFVAIDLNGTWIQMPMAYTGTADSTLQWSRLTAIHPAILSGDLRWYYLALQVGSLLLMCAGLLHVRQRRT